MEIDLYNIDNSIVKLLFSKYCKKRISKIKIFGSNILYNKQNSDIDIFIIKQQKLDYEHRIIDRLDITSINSNVIAYYISNFDPIVTEPILTGRSIYSNNFQEPIFSEIESNKSLCKYLINRSKKFYSWTRTNFISYQNMINNLPSYYLSFILLNLSFVTSYLLYSVHYRTHSNVITFAELLDNYPNTIAMELIKQKCLINPDLSLIKCFIKKVDNTFNDNTNIDWILDNSF